MRSKIFLIGVLVCAFALIASARADDVESVATADVEPVNLDVQLDEDVVEVINDDELADDNDNDDDDGPDEEAVATDPAPSAQVPEVTSEATEAAATEETEATDAEATSAPKQLHKNRSGKYLSYDDYLNGNLDFGTDTIGDPNYNYDANNRVAPAEPATHRNDGGGYSISSARLAQLRSNFLYWFFDQGGNQNNGDYQTDIHASMPQLHKNFNFQLPFFGFRFNYTRVSMNGMLEFSDPPEHYTYPLTFPIREWPRRNDPSFIGIFFSKCRIGRIRQTDVDQRAAGVYFRQERDLMTRTDRFGVEVRERTMWDIRTGVVGAETFVPKHVVIITWKNMTFAGGIDVSLYKTNSFQMVLATDEVFTYAIFNYIEINWSSHTEAGGDTTGGEGGVPAYIGFNAGNGTQAYEYKPYSQASVLRDLTGRGWANGFPGRHIFRIDERIMLGTCNKDIDAAHLPLVFAPESGNMMGGTIVNITGPCFNQHERVMCRFDTEDVVGIVVDRNRAICVQPRMLAQGYIRFEISIGTEKFKWKGRYFVETPATATEKIFFETDAVFERSPPEIRISWNAFNLTSNLQASLNIQLFGYDERTIKPNLQMIDVIEQQTINSGVYVISPANFRLRDNGNLTHFQFGFLRIMLNDPVNVLGLPISPQLWSKPIPLGWYFGPQWERIHGRDWPRAHCNNWFNIDRNKRDFANNIALCPCTLEQALNDKGRFLPDFDCDRDGNPTCRHHRGAIHCVRSGQPNAHGAEQQCCYDRVGYLMMSYDQMWGSRPRRNHNIGQVPWNEANKVPTLSTWYNDIIPYYSCCLWAGEQSVGCETYRFERRPTQDCVSYQPPGVAAIFGDPHVVTFDNLQYTFNGMGEFVLVRVQNSEQRFDVQGRFEEVRQNIHGRVMATQLTSIVARGNESIAIEVRLRPRDAQWRYRLDVIADGRRLYFDRPSLKFQHFFGATVYTPTYILNQSEVVIMFSSGAGVEVVENNGHMTARVYMPWNFINQTRGLFGNWSFNMADDLALPNGQVVPVNLNNFETLHRDFAMQWMLSEREQPGIGGALFHRENGRSAAYFANATFRPNFIREPRDFLPPNRSQDIELASDLCGESYQCRFDFGMTLDREMAHFTKNYFDSAVNIRTTNDQRILSCGVLETPRFGRKSNFLFVPGSTVSFECNEGFILMGDPRRTCTSEGRWDPAEYGYTECMRHVFYSRRVAWIAIAIIIAVILPIIMCVVCAVYCYRRKALHEDPDWKMSLPRSRSGSRTTLRHLGTNGHDDGGDGDSTLKKKKKWDLDDEDFTSSDGSEFPTGVATKRTDDIQYLNRSDPQRQTGRRGAAASRLDSEPIAEESVQRTANEADDEEDNELPPPPPQSAANPVSPTYSPTYSGLDRNSSGFGSQPGQFMMRQPNAIRVLPTTSSNLGGQTDSRFFGEGSMSPTSASSPVPQQDVGLPKLTGTKSTEV